MCRKYKFLLFIILQIGIIECVNAQTSSVSSDWRNQVNVIVKEFDQSNGLPVISVSDLIIG